MKLLQRHRFFREVAVDSSSGPAACRGGPDHERLAAAHVARGKDALDGGHVVGVGHVAADDKRHTQLLDHAVADRTEEAHRQQDQIDIERELGTRNRFELRRRADVESMQLLDVAVFITGTKDRADQWA